MGPVGSVMVVRDRLCDGRGEDGCPGWASVGGIEKRCLHVVHESRMVPAQALAKQAGLSPRQLDYWTSRGWVRTPVANPGTGHQRMVAESEVAVLRLAVLLISEGFTPERAIGWSRRLWDAGTVDAGPVTVSLREARS